MTQLVWPNGSSTTEPARSDDWGWRTGYTRPFHTGQDWHSIGSLKAIGAGTVVENHWGGWAGNQVLLSLGDIDGVPTWARYCHLAYAPSYSLGTQLALGATVGQEGNTGESDGSHLHLEIYRGVVDRGDGNGPAATVNPRTFIAAHLNHTSTPTPLPESDKNMIFIYISDGAGRYGTAGKNYYASYDGYAFVNLTAADANALATSSLAGRNFANLTYAGWETYKAAARVNVPIGS